MIDKRGSVGWIHLFHGLAAWSGGAIGGLSTRYRNKTVRQSVRRRCRWSEGLLIVVEWWSHVCQQDPNGGTSCTVTSSVAEEYFSSFASRVELTSLASSWNIVVCCAAAVAAAVAATIPTDNSQFILLLHGLKITSCEKLLCPHVRAYSKVNFGLHIYGGKPAAGEHFFCPPTLPYMTYSALSEEELGLIPPFHQARTANLQARFPFPVGTLKYALVVSSWPMNSNLASAC